MEYVYTTLILNELNREINERNITAVLEAAGVETVSESRVKALVAALEGVDVDEVAPGAPDDDGRTATGAAVAEVPSLTGDGERAEAEADPEEFRADEPGADGDG